MKIPNGWPVPPANPTPPRIAAVSTLSAKLLPIDGLALPILEVVKKATKPMRKPLITKAPRTTFLDEIPTRSAAIGLPPVA